MLTVNFILPCGGHNPVGGFKVVYIYANALASRGYKVIVTHPLYLRQEELPQLRHPRRWITYLKRRVTGAYRPDAWFTMDARVELRYTPSLEERYIPMSDVVIATSWETAEWVAGYAGNKGRKLYLIQHFESWSGERERVLATWRLPLQKLVIAKWLQEIAENMGETAIYLPNGLDQQEFFVETSLPQRDPYLVGSLYHTYEWKGTADVLGAMAVVVEQLPQVRLILFGTNAEPEGLPAWVEYHHRPSGATLRALYNRMSVFVSASWEEGWGLTPCEALLCGCAVAVTDNGGHLEFATHAKTALVFPVKDRLSMAEAILKLILENELRFKLAEQGSKALQCYSWDASYKKLMTALRG